MKKRFVMVLGACAPFVMAGCALVTPPNEYNGYLTLDRYNKTTVESIIKDGQTTRGQMTALLGYPVHQNPSIASGMACKPTAKGCYYVVNVIDYDHSVAYIKSLTVYYDEKDVVKTHSYGETRRPF